MEKRDFQIQEFLDNPDKCLYTAQETGWVTITNGEKTYHLIEHSIVYGFLDMARSITPEGQKIAIESLIEKLNKYGLLQTKETQTALLNKNL